jgi:uncharacterized cupin superfamily protein
MTGGRLKMESGQSRNSGKTILMAGLLGAAFFGLACAGGASAPDPAPEPAAQPESAANPEPVAQPEVEETTESTEGAAADPTSPLRLDASKLAGVGLNEDEPLPAEIILEGGAGNRGHIFFSSDQIVVEVWGADASKLAFREPQIYDEFVTILSGQLILTDHAGIVTEYKTGESLVVPKGFTGIWQMVGDYRELIVIQRAAYDEAYPPE